MKKLFYPLFITSLAFFITSLNPVINTFLNGVNAQDITSEEYSIKKGDTLWDISKDKLQDSFLWPKLWKENPQIKNPDLIYPGDKIIIPLKEIIIPKVEAPKELPKKPEEKIPVVVKPEIFEEKPVVEIPEEIPKQYIVDKNLYIASGWISEVFTSIGKIIEAPTKRTIFGSGDYVYLKINKAEVSGERFFAIRKIKVVKHPKRGKILGNQIRVTGILKIIGKDNNVPKAQIATAFEDLQIGDSIMPFQEIEPPIVPEILRTPDVSGYIVESHMNTLLTRAGDIVYLDRGENDGLRVGDILSVFSSVPLKRSIGTLQVISLQPTTSAAIILKNEQEITIGDTWGNK
jgi:LysM repeat protein